MTLIPCLDAAHRYSLLPLICSLFPVPCSLKSRNCVPHSYDNCYNMN
ncbi:MAG: hypothetical protein F6J90_22670 [Moorea sp. SIOASIH]|nr:hypothetical protein [Moorena sp. SIOASIH]NEO38986.1 hypothetical protein [Moorena sp. SIOASIH]